jgi:hypothetical protein
MVGVETVEELMLVYGWLMIVLAHGADYILAFSGCECECEYAIQAANQTGCSNPPISMLGCIRMHAWPIAD